MRYNDYRVLVSDAGNHNRHFAIGRVFFDTSGEIRAAQCSPQGFNELAFKVDLARYRSAVHREWLWLGSDSSPTWSTYSPSVKTFPKRFSTKDEWGIPRGFEYRAGVDENGYTRVYQCFHAYHLSPNGQYNAVHDVCAFGTSETEFLKNLLMFASCLKKPAIDVSAFKD